MFAFYSQQGGHGTYTSVSADAALEDEARFPNTTRDAQRMIACLLEFTGGGRLLDVGAGYGFFCREAERAGFVVTALEIAAAERNIARTISGVEPLPLQFEDYSPVGATFDAIVMSQVLEHAVDPRAWLLRASDCLRPGGSAVIAVPNFGSFLRHTLQHRDPYITPPVHLNYFTWRSLSRLIASVGLMPTLIQTVTRVSPQVISKRIPRAPASVRRFSDNVVKVAQAPAARLVDPIRLGLFLNIYARKPGSSCVS